MYIPEPILYHNSVIKLYPMDAWSSSPCNISFADSGVIHDKTSNNRQGSNPTVDVLNNPLMKLYKLCQRETD